MRAQDSSSRVHRRTAALGLVLSFLLLALLPASAGAASRETTSACPAGAVPDAGLPDVPSGSTHAAAVKCLLWWGITRGTAGGGYDPGGVVTRGQMASFLARLLDRTGDILPETAGDRFSDDDGSTHEASINRLAAAGVTTGRADGSFGPTDPVSRAQMASFLARTAARLLPQELATGGDAFVDDNDSPHEASINAVAEAGIAAGVAARRYDPASGVRRDQMASFLTRTADLVVDGRLGLLSVSVAGLPAGAVPPVTALSPAAGTRRSAGPGVLAVPEGSWVVTAGALDFAGASWAAVQSPSLPVSGEQVTPVDLLYTSGGGDRVADDVEALTGQDAQAVTAYDPLSGEVRLAGAAAARVQAGEVLVAEPSVAAPDGVLARVTDRDATPDGRVVLTVAPATLVDVYPDGTEAPLEVQPDSITFVPAEGVTVTNTVDRQGQAAGDRSAQATEMQVRGPTVRLDVDARVGLSEPIGDLDPASPWSAERGVFVAVKGPVAVTPVAKVQVGLRDAAVGIEARTSASLDVGVGAALGAQGKLEPAFRKDLGKIRATGCQSFVCATLEGKVVVVVSAGGELRYDVRLDSTGRVLGGVRVDGDGQQPWTERDSTLSVRPIGAAGAGEVEAYVGPELALKIYGVVGPFLAGGAYGSSAMAIYSDDRLPTCSYEGGARLTYGIRAEFKILGRGIEASRERQHDWPLRSGACTLTGVVGNQPVTHQQLLSAAVPSLCGHPAGRLVNGQLPGLDPTQGVVQLVDSLFADLDGDGRDEGVATLECTYGGNANYLSVHVYGTGPTHIGRADIEGDREIQRSRGVSLQDVRVVDGALEVTALDGDADDSTCCPSVVLSRRFDVTPTGLATLPARPPGLADPVTPAGWGSLRVGDLYPTVALATGWAVDVDGLVEDDLNGDCSYAIFDPAPGDVSGIGGNGRLGALGIGDPRLRTEAGVGVGSSEQEVLSAYGHAGRRVDNIYSDIDDVVVGPSGGRVLRFQFTEDRRVAYVQAGEEGWALLPEGCA